MVPYSHGLQTPFFMKTPEGRVLAAINPALRSQGRGRFDDYSPIPWDAERAGNLRMGDRIDEFFKAIERYFGINQPRNRA
jgi:hypothetical protein